MNFKQIIEENGRTVKRIIKKITNEENEDLEQEVYFRVAKNSDKYSEKGSFKSWISTIARNVSFDYLKSSKTKCEKLSDDDTIFDNLKDKSPTPDSVIIGKERQQRILDTINTLKPKFKEVIVLTEFYGLSYEECAKRLKCPIGTIKSRIYNAKVYLAEQLQDLL